ncbi:heavy metal-associated isoprenylated plant protein 3-like [Silene latifolia]|uniref:heavy metal-associated isoprenylated plant protein 3-like n=1 Tax=Silene latifolia TaxID=37657 RepID=UPI003D7767FE
MGEKQEKDTKNNEGEKKAESGVTTTVLKFDMHCEGCAKKVRKSLKNFQGVESVKTDCSTNKLVVTGNVDPIKLKERVEEKMKKKVELVSLQPPVKPAKEGGEKKSDDKKPEEKKSEGKSDDKKSEDNKKDKEKTKEPPVATVQLKTIVHCEGCAHKIKKIVSRCEGVQDVNVDLQKDLITVKGTMNLKELLPYLNIKLKRIVELAPSKKEDGSGGDKKPKEADAKPEKPKESSDEKKEGGGDKKNGPSGGDISKDNVTKIEVSKMEYTPFSYDYGYAPIYDPRMLGEGSSSSSGYGHGHQSVGYWHEPEYSHPPQMFSDENPNACSVM